MADESETTIDEYLRDTRALQQDAGNSTNTNDTYCLCLSSAPLARALSSLPLPLRLRPCCYLLYLYLHSTSPELRRRYFPTPIVEGLLCSLVLLVILLIAGALPDACHISHAKF